MPVFANYTCTILLFSLQCYNFRFASSEAKTQANNRTSALTPSLHVHFLLKVKFLVFDKIFLQICKNFGKFIWNFAKSIDNFAKINDFISRNSTIFFAIKIMCFANFF